MAVNVISCKDSSEKVPPENINRTTINKFETEALVGNWLRTDGDYRIEIFKVNDDGTLVAHYFNPNPINVGKANWEEREGSLNISVELRDVNYPGSTYSLIYVPERDILTGDYYQAVEGIIFSVEFLRVH